MNKNDAVRNEVLEQILQGSPSAPCGRAKYSGKGKIIHMRFCSSSSANSHLYKFNINPNTLAADYEVWICGSASCYYLVPKSVITQIYNDPAAYIDNHHPKIRVVSVDSNSDSVMYATGGKSINLQKYRVAVLSRQAASTLSHKMRP